MEDPRRRDIALFRYGLIREAADPDLTPAERGRLVRALAAREHRGPDGEWRTVGRSTLDRWIVAYRTGGFDALVPGERRREPVCDVELLDLAVKLKRENPARTATHIVELIVTELAGHDRDRQVPSERTVQRHFARLGLNVRPDGSPPEAFGRFEAAAVNDLWVGDVAHGPKVGGRKALLFAFLDDHSRLIVGHRWGRSEDVLRLEAALRRGLASRGVPKRIYVDNGSPFVSHQLARACAVLGIRLVHSKPGRPQGRGKIERFFATVRAQFLVEIADDQLASLEELNRLFTAWVETRYHHRPHRETSESPLVRFTAAGIPEVPTPSQLREAFLWAETRTVTKTAQVSLHGNHYQVDPVLVGRRIQLVFDPFDLGHLQARLDGRDFGTAIPHELKVHVHPKATAEPPETLDGMTATGIDYLALIEQEHHQATRRTINFADLADHDGDDVQEDSR
ncbi:MAG: DDE-type integrase/transposase/recombinase [Nitriliruptoraceae bacterium]